MPPALSTTSCAAKPRGAAAWLFVASLLLGLLCLAHITRPALVQPQAAHRPAPPHPALVLSTAWHH